MNQLLSELLNNADSRSADGLPQVAADNGATFVPWSNS